MSATVDSSLFARYFGDCPVINVEGRTHPVSTHFLEDVHEKMEYCLALDSPASGAYFSQHGEKWKHAGSSVNNRRGKKNLVLSSWGDESVLSEDYVNPHYTSDCYQSYSERTNQNLKRLNEDVIDLDLLEDLICYIDENCPPGAVLVFLPGVAEIEMLIDRLSASVRFRGASSDWILPLHSLLAPTDQRKVFQSPPENIRKVIVATDIAETSITIDDVIYVVDTGKHKENRYNPQKKMSSIVEDWISRANAKQRRGRAGRVKPGMCFCMYTRHRFEKMMRPFQVPEMLRMPLTELCLQIKSLHLGPRVHDAARLLTLCLASGRTPLVAGHRSSFSGPGRRRRAPPAESAEMAMRHLIAGQNNCAPDGASSSNPFGALANAVLGQSSKAQSIKELPGAAVSVPTTSDFSTAAPLSTIPGSEPEFKQDQRPLARGTDFIRGGPANDWVESFRPPGLPEFSETRFAEFDQIYNNAGSTFGPALDGPPQRVLSGVLHSFLASGQAGVPFQPVPVPALGLSEGDKQCIRDRSCIMARHILADQPEEYIQAQVNTLLHSLDIDNDYRMRGPMHGPYPELEEYWNQSQSALRSAPMHDAADKWITEFGKQNNNPEDWAHSFDQQYGPNGWASEFEQHQSQMVMGQMGGANMANLAAMEQSRMLAQTLASNNDPKFQLSQGADKWVSEFSTEHNQDGFNEKWIDEFSKLRVDDEWAEEFSGGALGESSGDPWVDEFHDQLSASKQNSGASRGVYVFSEMNPYVGHPNPMQEGQELFRKGLLSEAVLALEAEVLKNPDNVEGWRLLGITHAENDDDQQAIAAMMRAQEADPTNLEVLLALGVSHTNELEQGEALRYLYRWLQNHPKYGGLTPPQPTDSPYGPDVVRLFNEAAQMSPEDADVHIVLGVLYNLSREYDKAIASFKIALQLKPRDYSLWNKLGATQANSIQSADAILAYQQALDLKPNYVRAWANMGISYANQ